ncbi:hypothetical protein D7V64_15890 [Acinetobacter cumulans]|jgi:hypothetical protein|uniref:Uncharacterized protein n=1 Tax=Acinetobacter cumulans TaxID=2136182 RepID=A0A3A8FYE1_9GAMM|nr:MULTISPECIES: hypothetical protein [Acinetobacter]RKG48040.1 hypothetical protein D7V64_15890 [Acinetobacter cumulans]
MTQEKAKKRGRPAKLLQVAELHDFVEYLLEKHPRTDLQNQVIDDLQAEDFNFEMLSEAQQILVREALKPYREHIKLKTLFDQLSTFPEPTEYETKFIELFKSYKNQELGNSELNILKTMFTRYQRFKAQELQMKDLELYLTQIQKKDEGKKRKADNQRKFELGGAVIAAFKKMNKKIPEDVSQVTNLIIGNDNFCEKISQTDLYQKVCKHEDIYSKKVELFIKVLDGFTTYKYGDQKLFEYEVEKQKRENTK